MKKKNVVAIITAAGGGKRLKGQVEKQFRNISGKPVLAVTLDVFDKTKAVNDIILTVPRAKVDYCRRNIVRKYGYRKSIRIVAGGANRRVSVFNALKEVPEDCSIVVIHDGVRPFVTEKIVNDSIRAAEKYGASLAAVPLNDTIKKADRGVFVQKTIDRDKVWRVQTPQTFRYDIIIKAHKKAARGRSQATDDAAMVEKIGKKVKIIQGSYRNIKITTPEDLRFAEAILGEKKKELRYGIGYDAHRLVTGRKFVLGGIVIPFKKGLLGHSDGDALLHSISDAILGALGERDIGTHFPDTDMQYKGISSIILLERVAKIMSGAGYKVNNLDAMIIAQKPKMSPHINKMIKKISGVLKTKPGNLDVKATTNEGLGLIGAGKGVAVYSVVSIIGK